MKHYVVTWLQWNEREQSADHCAANCNDYEHAVGVKEIMEGQRGISDVEIETLEAGQGLQPRSCCGEVTL